MDLAVPISGGPYFSEFRVLGFVELALDVGFVGFVSGSDSEVSGGVIVVGLEREEEEESEGKEERENETFSNEWFFHFCKCMTNQPTFSLFLSLSVCVICMYI